MRYWVWTFLALATYTFVPPLMQLTTSRASTGVATFVAAGMLSLSGLALALFNGEAVLSQIATNATYVVGTGLFLAVGVLSFFIALSQGPVSIVTPVFGLFLVTSSVIGGLVLGESLTVQRLAGLGVAILAIVLISLE